MHVHTFHTLTYIYTYMYTYIYTYKHINTCSTCAAGMMIWTLSAPSVLAMGWSSRQIDRITCGIKEWVGVYVGHVVGRMRKMTLSRNT